MSSETLVPPRPSCTVDLRSPDGAVIRVRRLGNPAGPRVMLSHGNGFAIEGYYAFWRHFLDDCEVVLHDLRNHGENPLHDADHHNYDGFVQDWEMLRVEIPRLFGTKPTAGLYHSASALTSLHHAHAHGWHWDALVLFDPPILPGEGEALHDQAVEFEHMMAGWAAERPDHFDDPADLAEAFKSTRSLAGWALGSHELIARSILRPDPGRSGWTLACPKALESALYASNAVSTLWSKLPALVGHKDRLLILSSDPDARGAKSPSLVLPHVGETWGYEVAIVPGTSHLMQLEKPELVADMARSFLARKGLLAAEDGDLRKRA